MKFKVQQIADMLEGTLEGNPEIEVNKLSKIEEGSDGSLSFLSNPKYNSYLYSTKASAVIVNDTFVPEQEISCTLIKVPDSYKAFSKLLEFYQAAKLNKKGVEQPSYIHESATYAEDLYLGAFSYLAQNVKIGANVKIFSNVHIAENVTIGDHTIIYSGAKIMSDTVIGSHVIINSGCVLGADGFGFSPEEDGSYSKIPQIGNVIIEDYVDIGALTSIDRATLGSTIIRKGVKLDNQIQIAHNVEIGENTVIASQTGIAGSSKIGKNCRIGGQVGIAGHLTIGDNVGIQAQSGIGKNIKSNSNIQGSPAFDYGEWNRSYVNFKNLPGLDKRVRDLEKNNA
ncbi:UDP-3-O-(3-hydroxymyristoyl)glucosamine N-acyltransferase [Nonlabens antarcticus]|uniref:UDP-3-O-(3-hydroxymyristoyl)glucosamine N-acyltransferase n=1 Tax=Nonlabens antarcticus TaxID=392714 RepID=UPI0018919E74|nr:UDP-3-O-(3-hydroxymyristoyl)glucosamine N-acyltransferase [Nonlabens antarcticus]